MKRKVPRFSLPFFSSGLAAISSSWVMPYWRLMLNMVSLRCTLCMSRHSFIFAGAVSAVSVRLSCGFLTASCAGMAITCPVRKLLALSPGLALQMACAVTLYFSVSW